MLLIALYVNVLRSVLITIEICFSLKRYYVAEGVRIYSQQSWKMIFGTEGKHMVEKYITETVSGTKFQLCFFYIIFNLFFNNLQLLRPNSPIMFRC